MESWYRSDVSYERMEGLVKRGLLRGRTDAMEWLVPGHEDMPMPPDYYIFSFAPFHERGLAIRLIRSSGGCCTTTRSSCSI